MFFFPAGSNTNVFDSFEALFVMFNLTRLLIYLLEIHELVHDNLARVLQYTVDTTM